MRRARSTVHSAPPLLAPNTHTFLVREAEHETDCFVGEPGVAWCAARRHSRMRPIARTHAATASSSASTIAATASRTTSIGAVTARTGASIAPRIAPTRPGTSSPPSGSTRRGDRIDARLDRRGEARDRQLDRRGQNIDRRMDRRGRGARNSAPRRDSRAATRRPPEREARGGHFFGECAVPAAACDGASRRCASLPAASSSSRFVVVLIGHVEPEVVRELHVVGRHGLARDDPRTEVRFAQPPVVTRLDRARLAALSADGRDVERPPVCRHVEIERDLRPRIGLRARAAIHRGQRRDEIDHRGFCEERRGVDVWLRAQRGPRLSVVVARGRGIVRDDRPVAERRERQAALDGVDVRVLLEDRDELRCAHRLLRSEPSASRCARVAAAGSAGRARRAQLRFLRLQDLFVLLARADGEPRRAGSSPRADSGRESRAGRRRRSAARRCRAARAASCGLRRCRRCRGRPW